MDNSHAPFNPLGIKCPYCPVCGAEPVFSMVGITPWFCPNDDCRAVAWDPFATALRNLSERYNLDLEDENSAD
jgi:hypothetical protein